jgi:PilZ domain
MAVRAPNPNKEPPVGERKNFPCLEIFTFGNEICLRCSSIGSITYGRARGSRVRPDLALVEILMARPQTPRACRHRVRWPARVRSVAAAHWHSGEVVNLSVTGVLLQIDQTYDFGERVEFEIDFVTQRESKMVVSGVGRVVRGHPSPAGAAIQFDVASHPKAALANYRASRARRASLNDFTPSAM